MSSRNDKLFSRQKLAKKKLARQEASKPTKPFILIATEGSKTEPNYIRRFIRFHRLTNVKVEILDKGTKSAPETVVSLAEEKILAERTARRGGYNKLFVVIDRDEHENFDDAIRSLSAMSKLSERGYVNEGIKLIASYPCIEIWFLYHFIKTNAPFVRMGNKSPCSCAIKKLRETSEEFKSYDKVSGKGIDETQFVALMQRYERAVSNAKHSCEQAELNGQPNSSTNMYELTEYLLQTAV